MEHGRRTGWTGRRRPQRASAHSASATLRVTTLIVSPALPSALHVLTSSKIAPSTTLTGSAVRPAFLPFLTGSAPQTEFPVTHSKQKVGEFLTGARTAIRIFKFWNQRTQKSTRRGGLERVKQPKWNAAHGFDAFLPGSAQEVECDVTYSKQTIALFLPGATTAHYRLAAQLSNRQSNPFFRSQRLPLVEPIEGGKP